MHGRRVGVAAVALVSTMAAAQGSKAPAVCKRITVPGEVRYGEPFERTIGHGLEVFLQPIRSGWILRVRPVGGPMQDHDYAELATPPYNSVTPLSISTDFSFRAQDAVGWNPRAFRFAPDKDAYQRLSAAYEAFAVRGTNPPPAAQQEMARLVMQTYEGTFRILDARLIPGTADQWVQAAAVASHFSTTAHTLEQPADGRDTALGRLVWLKFQVELYVPDSFPAAAGLKSEARACAL